ncbi:MAG: LamG-like jellyroll fold domain-containing protein [Planctomycetia bacterium]|nr:LamG-like jellyroll fold domain-containing protein [Planctomycetia bacterium]
MRRYLYTMLFLAVAISGVKLSVFAADGNSPLVHISFNDGEIKNLGTFNVTGLAFSDAEGDQPTYVSTGIFDVNGTEIKAIKFDGTNYVDTTTTTGSLGISGAAPKTVSAIIKSDETGNQSLWSVGNPTDYQDFTIKVNGDNVLQAQLWGGDFNTYAPVSTKSNWGLVSQTYDGKTVRIYYNGDLTGSADVALNTGTSGTIKPGFWNALGNSYRGGMAEFKISDVAQSAAQIRQEALNLGGSSYTFNDSEKWATTNIPDLGWVNGCSNTMFSNVGYGVLDGKGIITYTATGNQELNGNADNCMGILWGSAFTVLDDTKEITAKVVGGHFEAPAPEDVGGTNISALRGKAGLVLYDHTEGKFLLDTYRCSDTNTGDVANTKTISLAGLKGHSVSLAIIDFVAASWGMTAVDDINIPLGTGKFWECEKAVVSTKTFNFDTAGDWEGWYEVDADGNRLDTVSNFQFGSPGTCHYYIGDNYITSTSSAGGWDAPTGDLRSEEFKLTGDIMEFMINGGHGTGDYGLQLWVQTDDTEDFINVLTAQRSASSNDFEYAFWDISEWEGMNAYLQLHDGLNGGWGWVGVDNIQMIDFDQVPETLHVGITRSWVRRTERAGTQKSVCAETVIHERNRGGDILVL